MSRLRSAVEAKIALVSTSSFKNAFPIYMIPTLPVLFFCNLESEVSPRTWMHLLAPAIASIVELLIFLGSLNLLKYFRVQRINISLVLMTSIPSALLKTLTDAKFSASWPAETPGRITLRFLENILIFQLWLIIIGYSLSIFISLRSQLTHAAQERILAERNHLLKIDHVSNFISNINASISAVTLASFRDNVRSPQLLVGNLRKAAHDLSDLSKELLGDSKENKVKVVRVGSLLRTFRAGYAQCTSSPSGFTSAFVAISLLWLIEDRLVDIASLSAVLATGIAIWLGKNLEGALRNTKHIHFAVIKNSIFCANLGFVYIIAIAAHSFYPLASKSPSPLRLFALMGTCFLALTFLDNLRVAGLMTSTAIWGLLPKRGDRSVSSLHDIDLALSELFLAWSEFIHGDLQSKAIQLAWQFETDVDHKDLRAQSNSLQEISEMLEGFKGFETAAHEEPKSLGSLLKYATSPWLPVIGIDLVMSHETAATVLSPRTERQIEVIVQEVILNGYKHGGATNFTIDTVATEHAITLAVFNNGASIQSRNANQGSRMLNRLTLGNWSRYDVFGGVMFKCSVPHSA